jgi:hypothetical protein
MKNDIDKMREAILKAANRYNKTATFFAVSILASEFLNIEDTKEGREEALLFLEELGMSSSYLPIFKGLLKVKLELENLGYTITKIKEKK